MKEGGAYINNERVSDAEAPLTGQQLLPIDGGSAALLRRGKRTLGAVIVRDN